MAILNRLFAAKNPPDQTEAILGKYLDADFRVFPMAKGRQSPDQLNAIGQKHGVVYPPEFSAHVCGQFLGIFVEVEEEVWPRPKEYDVGPFWSFLYALHTFTPATDSEPWMRLDDAATKLRTESGLLAAPILRIVGDADLFCIDPEGQLVHYRHETNELEPVSLTFWELFEREIAELRSRKDRKKASE
ncbi:MAG TPA: hypothetical protein VL282_06615 [Tepidisphaeraceae bacterium]|jgi:hypothetical protein|nr:hypothetical protein [Tepidisphaeraceae bacterium]